MNLETLRQFREIWLVDFEFCAPSGEKPHPTCLVATEVRTNRSLRVWEDELSRLSASPYPTDPTCLFVAYYASAELGCHLALNWPFPACILDLYVEFRNLTNGRETPCGWGLLGALAYFGLDGIDVMEKEEMRQLALRGGPWTPEEKAALLAYCESDVVALAKLLARMVSQIDLPRALLRGRYMRAAATIEHAGIPIDTQALAILRNNWENIQDSLIGEIDAGYGVFEGRTFKAARFERWLSLQNIPWPKLPSGALDLKDDTFRDMSKIYPALHPLRELRTALSQMRLSDLAVGSDGRNRALLSAFKARTGRNQPSNTQFIFGPSVWLRGLIRPNPGWGLAYVDWSQQEFGIAASLSSDPAMLAAYESGDPYVAFAQQAGAIPPHGTKSTHGPIREQYKMCALAVHYGMGADALALRMGQPTAQARHLLKKHRETYPTFWCWSDGAVDHAMLKGFLHTVFGWTIHVESKVNPRFLRNFPMQANGAEMLRLACCLATERGIRVCAPVHDALLIEAPLDELDQVIRETQEAMANASAAVLNGFRLRSDAKAFRYPEHYSDERGERMWDTVWSSIQKRAPGVDVDLKDGYASWGNGHHQVVASAQQGCCTSAHPSSLLSVSLNR